ncbi:uncharacterized protein LOC101846551 [Aplysia californica]|uniref:Uncharacterized protein LOC101846551 n=1 Tax=Aplysia californica TaxID=6500 RepID=A0ABM0KA56_APLCA|nr:uncharacterized protein LOC101846551 [Aplysia californica]XP_005112616.1 uncharacterized protein LOC101846551 [Aplysia californica]XP_005112617.1 uncharacterized protein LOC101846551 [Aplysia californica]XP_012945978.1 uncharacterized protein LOC101846551 [Aplysia californica]
MDQYWSVNPSSGSKPYRNNNSCQNNDYVGQSGVCGVLLKQKSDPKCGLLKPTSDPKGGLLKPTSDPKGGLFKQKSDPKSEVSTDSGLVKSPTIYKDDSQESNEIGKRGAGPSWPQEAKPLLTRFLEKQPELSLAVSRFCTSLSGSQPQEHASLRRASSWPIFCSSLQNEPPEITSRSEFSFDDSFVDTPALKRHWRINRFPSTLSQFANYEKEKACDTEEMRQGGEYSLLEVFTVDKPIEELAASQDVERGDFSQSTSSDDQSIRPNCSNDHQTRRVAKAGHLTRQVSFDGDRVNFSPLNGGIDLVSAAQRKSQVEGPVSIINKNSSNNTCPRPTNELRTTNSDPSFSSLQGKNSELEAHSVVEGDSLIDRQLPNALNLPAFDMLSFGGFSSGGSVEGVNGLRPDNGSFSSSLNKELESSLPHLFPSGITWKWVLYQVTRELVKARGDNLNIGKENEKLKQSLKEQHRKFEVVHRQLEGEKLKAEKSTQQFNRLYWFCQEREAVVEKLVTERYKVQGENVWLKRNYGECQMECEKHRTWLTETEKKLNRIKREDDSKQRKIRELEAEMDKVQNKLQRSQACYDQVCCILKEERDHRTSEIAELKIQIENLKDENGKLQYKLELRMKQKWPSLPNIPDGAGTQSSSGHSQFPGYQRNF